MYGILNLLSFLLGLFSWILGFAALLRRSTKYSAGSMTACAAALFFQIIYTQHLVTIHDFSAIEDTHRAVTLAASVLLAGTLVLNVPVWAKKSNTA